MTRVLFGFLIFFAKLCLKVGGAAYTRVFTVLLSLLTIIFIIAIVITTVGDDNNIIIPTLKQK